jgi:hypothetical protein
VAHSSEHVIVRWVANRYVVARPVGVDAVDRRLVVAALQTVGVGRQQLGFVADTFKIGARRLKAALGG